MVAFLTAAGFHDARESQVRHLVKIRGEEEYLRSFLTATPIGHSLSEETEEVQKEVLAKTRANLRQWQTADGLAIPAECVLVTARR
jgi:hypothetical protein